MGEESAPQEAKLRCLSGATSDIKANYWIFQKFKKWLLNGYHLNHINLQLDELPKKQEQSILKSLCFLIIFLHSLRPLVERDAVWQQWNCKCDSIQVTDGHGRPIRRLSPRGVQWWHLLAPLCLQSSSFLAATKPQALSSWGRFGTPTEKRQRPLTVASRSALCRTHMAFPRE